MEPISECSGAIDSDLTNIECNRNRKTNAIAIADLITMMILLDKLQLSID